MRDLNTKIDVDRNYDTVRDIIKDRIKDLLEGYNLGKIDLTTLVCKIADEAFSVCGIGMKKRDKE